MPLSSLCLDSWTDESITSNKVNRVAVSISQVSTSSYVPLLSTPIFLGLRSKHCFQSGSFEGKRRRSNSLLTFKTDQLYCCTRKPTVVVENWPSKLRQRSVFSLLLFRVQRSPWHLSQPCRWELWGWQAKRPTWRSITSSADFKPVWPKVAPPLFLSL